MVYGIMTRQSVRLSEVVRSLEENIPPIRTENRLSINLACENLQNVLQEALAKRYKKHIEKNSLLVLDLSDISKKYAQKMEYLARVRDGSEKEIAKQWRRETK